MPTLERSVIYALAFCWFSCSQAIAEDDERFSVSGEFEVFVEAVTQSDDPDAELRDTSLSLELEGDMALGERFGAFFGLTLESVLDPTRDRVFEDLGLYFDELGLFFKAEPANLSFGKISPAFGSAWDTAPGYFGADFAEDYELEEQIGAEIEIEIGEGTIAVSTFYADNTSLSDSWGTQRGKTRLSDGGAGNTGKLNNVAAQYTHTFNDTTLHLGARHLSRGFGDLKDEKGYAIGVTQEVNDAIEVIAEAARFDGWEGSTDSARFATVGLRLVSGPVVVSMAFTQRDVSSSPTDRLFALGLDYELKNEMLLSGGYADKLEGGEGSSNVAFSLTIPLD
ncbi:MAG: porin [Pseudomonadota bacterium]